MNRYDIEWFKAEMAPKLNEYKLEYKFFSEGDFGLLNQVEFNSDNIGGNIDFWGLGWLGIFVWDYHKEEELINVLINPGHNEAKEVAVRRLKDLLLK